MMKKIFSTTLSLSAQGWPAQYDGVMLQGFYWDSYSDSKWTTLTAQADELSQYFKLIWVPNSGKTSDFYHNNNSKTMGYDPCFWLDHTSCWGTETELKTMIQTFKAKGTGFIADVVINHKNGRDTWVDFPNETKGSYSITWDNTDLSDICQNDECNSHLSEWATGAYSGKKATGARDSGDNFDGYRDLDHTNENVQKNVKTYLDFLIKELGYVGFRYDMVAGYKSQYTGEYNASAKPTYSVGEYWKDNGKSGIVNWINGGSTALRSMVSFSRQPSTSSRSGTSTTPLRAKATGASSTMPLWPTTPAMHVMPLPSSTITTLGAPPAVRSMPMSRPPTPTFSPCPAPPAYG